MTGFKGTRNTNGRPKGALNKDTTTIRETFQSLIESNLGQLTDDLQQLEPKDRIKTILELAKFIIPTMKATEYSVSDKTDITPTEIVFRVIDPNDFNHENN